LKCGHIGENPLIRKDEKILNKIIFIENKVKYIRKDERIIVDK